jgi:hypothetical protein
LFFSFPAPFDMPVKPPKLASFYLVTW